MTPDEFRWDGWPICPICGEDELADLVNEQASIKAALFCYRCCRVTVQAGQCPEIPRTMTVARLTIAFLTPLLIVACAPATSYTRGIPNLHTIDRSFVRSGQPTTLDQWRYLHDSLGITDVAKLDFADEGSDDQARLAGISVHVLSIMPTTDPDTVAEIVDGFFARPAHDRIVELKRLIAEVRDANAAGGKRRVLIHCKNGHDRTGLASLFVRVLVDGWTKKRAWDEARKLGFHPELIGLLREWQAL